MSFLGKWLKSSKAYWPTPTRWATLASFPLIPIVIIHILLLSFTRHIAWPENFLWPYLNLNGLEYYRDIFFIYPPLYPLLLSFATKALGNPLTAMVSLTWVTVIATDILLWLVSKKRVFALLIYIPIQIYFEGNGLWPDLLLAPLFLLALLAVQNKKFMLSGIILGFCLLTKQTAIYFVAAIIISSTRNFWKVTFGVLIPLIIGVFWLRTNNLQGYFFEETINYIFSYHVKSQTQIQYPSLSQIFVACLVFVPAVMVGIRKKQKLLVTLTVLAALGIFTRFEYFHLQPALPLAALLLSQTVLSIPFGLLFSLFFVRFFIGNFNQQPRFLTPDIKNGAKIINSYIPAGSKTLFINTWDHYYFLTKTLPVGNFFMSSTPWNLDYPGIQERQVNNLTRELPKYIVFGKCFWIKNICYQPTKIKAYVEEHYTLKLELPDGTGIFEYNPVGLGQKL